METEVLGEGRPEATRRIGEANQRDRVVVTGIVVRVEPVRWVGGPVLEVQLRDVSGSICLAFLGRKAIGGVEPGTLLTAAGTVGLRDGHSQIMNPQYWLAGPDPAGARSDRSGVVDIPTVTTHA